MKYPVIIVPALRVDAIAIFPFIFVKNELLRDDEITIAHERIHLRQEIELLIFPFYIFYLINYLVNLIRCNDHHQAYMDIIFEREAYANEKNKRYLKNRPLWAWRYY